MLSNLVEYLTVHNQIRDEYRISCMFQNHRKDVICGVIVISKNSKLLLVQGRRTGKWSLPKGHIEEHETFEECAKRELLEETGIKVDKFVLKNDIAKLRVGLYYFYESDTEDFISPCDDSEVINGGWFSINDILDNKMELNADANYIFRCLKNSSKK